MNYSELLLENFGLMTDEKLSNIVSNCNKDLANGKEIGEEVMSVLFYAEEELAQRNKNVK